MKQLRYVLVLLWASALLVLALAGAVSAQTSSGTEVAAVPSTDAPRVGESFTVNLTISNVENLYGIDVTLNWNTSLLQATNAELLLGVDSHPGGVLHEVLPDAAVNDLSQSTGEFHLVATSVNPAPSFNGSGTIAIITFNVTDAGQANLNVQSELADHPLPGEDSSNFIVHTDVGLNDSRVPRNRSCGVAGGFGNCCAGDF